MLRSIALLLALALVSGGPAAAQEPRAPEAGTPGARAVDPARLLRSARAEQARFERVRRNHLPWAWGGGSGECDERIGRFCLTHGSGGDTEWEPPPEAPEVTRARERLLESLAAAAAVVPHDGWVAGQRVRYLLEAGRAEEAREAARACAAAEWWCAALLGFALHQAGRPGPADSAYSVALRLMPERERREWSDLSLILEGASLRDYRRLDPGERERFHAHFWRLANPLSMLPGNVLRSEHLSRNVIDRFQDRARSTEGIAWGDDLREILLRYGWPTGWERVRPRVGSLEPPSLISHYPDASDHILPPHEALFGPGDLGAGTWDVKSSRPRTGYTIPLGPAARARWLERFDHQVAVFRRGDSALVVAALRLPSDSVPGDSAVQAALTLLSPGGDSRVARLPQGALEGTVSTTAPTGSMLLGLEVLAPLAHRVARTRFGLRVPPLEPGLLAVSDLLLLRSDEELPDSLPDAIPRVRPSTRARPGERLGVYWEVYGLRAGESQTLTVSLRLVGRGGGWLRRAAERIGLLREAVPIRLRWQEQATPTPFLARSLAVQIPEVAPGEYTLELVITRAGREPLTVGRALEVVSR